MKALIPFDKTDGMNVDEWNEIANTYRHWEGKGEVEFRRPKRTLRQNSTIHALFPQLAVELNGLGIPLTFGTFDNPFTASWTPETAKEFFIQCYLAGKRTHKCSTAELANALDKLMHDVNSHGGQLSIKKFFKSSK